MTTQQMVGQAVPGVAQDTSPIILPQQSSANAIPITPQPIQLSPNSTGGPISNSGGAIPTPNNSGGVQSSQSTINPAAIQYIQQARQQGIDDNTIFNNLHQNGLIPSNTMVGEGGKPIVDGPQLHDTGSFLGNVAHSAGSFIGGIGNMIAHPIETAKNIGSVAEGLAETPVALLTGQKIDNPKYQSFIESVAQRYGGLDNLKTTMYQDPIGFLADVASIADAGAGVLGKTADIARAGEFGTAANVLDKGAQIANKVGELTNPINIAGKGISMVGDLTKLGLNKVADVIEKSNLRLTPAQKVAFDGKLPDVVNYIQQNIPAGNPETRFEAAGSRVNQIEEQIQHYLNTDAANVTLRKQDLLDAAENIKSQFKNDRDSIAIGNQIDDFKSTVEANYQGESISVSDLNQLKRSTFEKAFNQAGTKVSDAAEFALGDLMKTGIENATKDVPVMGRYPISEINRAYGVALNAKKLLMTAVGRPQVGFIEKLLIDALGFSATGPLGALGAHAATNYLPVTATKALASKILTKTANIPKIKLPSGITSGVNTLNQTNIKVRKP